MPSESRFSALILHPGPLLAVNVQASVQCTNLHARKGMDLPPTSIHEWLLVASARHEIA